MKEPYRAVHKDLLHEQEVLSITLNPIWFFHNDP
jgi:hypothetical protein